MTVTILGALALAVPAGLHGYALARRVAAPPLPVTGGRATPVVAAGGRDVLEEWLRRGVRGRTVVHVGAFLHSIPPEGVVRTIAPLRTSPGEQRAFRDAIRRSATDRSYLWAAVELGIARRIVFVEPRARLLARAEELERPVPAPGEPLDLRVRGLDRVAFDRVPSLREPMLLDVAASWFEDEDPEALRGALDSAGIRADVVTLNRLGGSADVSDAARRRLEAFAEALARSEQAGAAR